MSILDKFTPSQLKAAGGNCKSFATLEFYCELAAKYNSFRLQGAAKMEAYTWTSEECCISEDTVRNAVRFWNALNTEI